MVLAGGVSRCRFCDHALDPGFWDEEAPAPAPPQSARDVEPRLDQALPAAAEPARGPRPPEPPAPASPHRAEPQARSPGPEPGGSGASAPAATPRVAWPRLAAVLAAALLLVLLVWALRGSGSTDAEASTAVERCARQCDAAYRAGRRSGDVQLSHVDFMSQCMSRCPDPAAEE